MKMEAIQSKGYYQNLYGSAKETTSLTFRKNEANIMEGNVPEKYSRLLPLIPGERVLEIGSAEGVMSLLMARQKKKVFALEYTPGRHAKALQLKETWQAKGFKVDNCELILGDIFDNLGLLQEIDTVVADRVIYYFDSRIFELFTAIGKSVENVVLGGNGSRVKSYKKGDGRTLGEFAKYSTIEGMTEILNFAGYDVAQVVDEYHPVVIGRKSLT